MRLWKCHIDNFGKFTDFTVDFAENPCVFKEPNGWGKSTLAAFVKVMFYGFANEKKRGDTLERERLRYKPWQGGCYGGELEFDAGGKRYLLNRTFGSRESEDTFALYDAATNLKSDDFTANIGEELFQIDQESFLRTVYIAQNDCYAAATDSINAKIGNLADSLGDMRDYEKVQQVIKDLRNSLTPGRKTGSLKRQKAEIAELKDELRRVEAVEQSVAELEEKLQGSLAERRAVLEQRDRVSEEWERANREKAVEAKRLHYESIMEKLAEKRGAADRELAAFGGSAPDRELLQDMQNRRRLMLQGESEAAANILDPREQSELSRLRARFAKGVPDEAQLGRGQKLLAQLAELERQAAQKVLSEGERSEYERLRAGLAGQASVGGDRLEESLRLCGLYLDKKGGIGAKRAALSSMKQLARSAKEQNRQKEKEREARGKSRRAILWLLALLALAAGGFLLWAGQPAGFLALEAGQISTGAVILGVAFLCIGAALAVAAVLKGRRPAGRTAAGAEEAEEQDGQEEQDGVLLLEREIAEDEAQMLRAVDFVTEFLRDIGLEPEDFEEETYRVRDELYGLKNDLRRFGQLQAREQDYQNQGYEERQRRLWEEAEELLSPYCEKAAASREELAQLYAELERDAAAFPALENREKKYRSAQDAVRKSEQELQSFLEACGQSRAADPDEGLQEIFHNLQEYENNLRELDRLETERQKFEADFDIRIFQELRREGEDGESAEALKLRMNQLDERAEELWERVHAYQAQLDERQQELDALQAQRERLTELEREYEEGYAYYTNLGLVGEYLEKARESLSARYIRPVLESFRRNYELLAGETGEDFRMDTNIHVTRRALGAQRETGAFSLGNQDLVYIVLRVALVDAMYQEEKPFLILDDSFVNLDEARLGAAGAFLHRIAEDYQVIYFTCHESRAL